MDHSYQRQANEAKRQVALITGGARGIGKAVALAYAREGARLAICARTESEINDTVREIRKVAAKGKGWSCDVSIEDSVKDFVSDVIKEFGRIDVLVNNAGVMTRPVPITELEVKKWDYTIAVNLRGPFLVTKSVLPVMVKQKSGSIINVSSMVERGAYANFIAYATSKWGVEGFTQTLAAEVRSSNIGQLRRTRVCGNKINRLYRQSAGIGDRPFCLPCIR